MWAALAFLAWLPQYFGELSLPTAFIPLNWDIERDGYVAAIVAGFCSPQSSIGLGGCRSTTIRF
jgi:hypothetical protein